VAGALFKPLGAIRGLRLHEHDRSHSKSAGPPRKRDAGTRSAGVTWKESGPGDGRFAPDVPIAREDAASDLKAQAIEQTLIEATAAPLTPLGKALDVVVRYAADAQFDTLISNAVDERRWLVHRKGDDDGCQL